MKTKPAILQILALCQAIVLLAGPAFSQPGIVNPVTGLPATSTSRASGINPATGLQAGLNPATGLPASKPGELTPAGVLGDAFEARNDVETLMFNGQYEEALQRCLAFHDKYKASARLLPLLHDWLELGRRHPTAKQALIEIRDRDAREFAEGRGYADLFREIHDINGALHQDDATYALFNSFRDKDPDLTSQCQPLVEGLLMAKGEYQWLYEHLGDPQGKFDSIHRLLTLQWETQERMAARAAADKQRIEQLRQERGLANIPAFAVPDISAMRKKSAENGFVAQTHQLIEILVASGHKTDAEKIRGQALAVLDDPRLRSAVSDVEMKIK